MAIAERWKGHPPLPADLEARLPRVVDRLREAGADLVYVFGSAVADELEREPHDLDVAVQGLEEDRWRLLADLAELLGTDRIDLVPLEEAGPELRFRIVSEGRLLHSARPETGSRLEIRTVREVQDLSPFLRARIRYVRDGSSGRRLDPRSVERRLGELEEVLAELRRLEIEPIDVGRLERDLSRRWSLERGLLATANLVFDIANHICAGHFGVHPGTYEDAIRSLSARAVIRDETYGSLRGLGGFRNVLAHDYMDVDLGEVIRWRSRILDALPGWMNEVSAWMNRSDDEEVGPV